MIYFDNAATGGFKPNAVTEAAMTVIKYLSANPGRSGHRLSLKGAETVNSCRELLGEMFSASPDRVVFTKNCTEALNTAIFGTLKKGGHVIATTFEHNSVLRPLYKLKSDGLISLDVVRPSKKKSIMEAITERINSKTYMIVMTAVSNVTGELLPFENVGKLAKERGLLFLLDGAQGAGHIPIDIIEQNISILAVPAHKGLYGIMGAGALIFGGDVEIEPLTFGGTGNESFSLSQPQIYPERLEAGTLNLPAIAAFSEGVRYIKNNVENFSAHLLTFTEKIITELNDICGVTVYSKPNRSGIVAFAFEDIPSAEAADVYNTEYDIALRGGLHCAPLTHRFLNTEEGGLVRASLCVQNSTREINFFIRATKEIATKK